jgi:hypothetical protein
MPRSHEVDRVCGTHRVGRQLRDGLLMDLLADEFMPPPDRR